MVKAWVQEKFPELWKYGSVTTHPGQEGLTVRILLTDNAFQELLQENPGRIGLIVGRLVYESGRLEHAFVRRTDAPGSVLIEVVLSERDINMVMGDLGLTYLQQTQDTHSDK